MGFIQAIRRCLRKYVDFSGRASRAEYWWFALFLALVWALSLRIDLLLFGARTYDPASLPWLTSAMLALLLLPALAAIARRLHDTDRSGWWMLIGLIPMIGQFVLIFFLVLEGTPGQNRFGPPPVRSG